MCNPGRAVRKTLNRQHIEYQEQLQAKETLVREQLRRIGGLNDIPLLPIIPSPEEGRYRQRLRLHVDRKGCVGFLAPRSHNVVTIDSCLVAWEALPLHLRLVREWIASLRTVVVQVEVMRRSCSRTSVSFACSCSWYSMCCQGHPPH